MPYLKYQSPVRGVVWVELGGTPVSIGRSKDCGLALDDESASRKHAEVKYAQGAFYLCDLESKNGTFVNGRKVGTHSLKEGDLITVAGSAIRFHEKRG